MFLNPKNLNDANNFLKEIVDLGIEFKSQKLIHKKRLNIKEGLCLLESMPQNGAKVEKILEEFKIKILPYCTNFGSPNFMGFPDAGNSVAGIGGAILSDFLQQNLINQSFCGPSATFVEINTIRRLREIVGYDNTRIRTIEDVGGIITGGGTVSNSIGILLGRENKFPGTLEKGVYGLHKSFIVVPKGIGHYSVKSAQMQLGLGHNLLEVETKNFRYDLDKLKEVLVKYRGKITVLVAYCGDSRSMTVDNFEKIYDLVKSIDPKIWLHADACHGFGLGCSDALKQKIKGIEKFDSITTDPHKVFNLPYVISALLIKDPQKIKSIISISDLIMQEPFSFGQMTPFVGSKSWLSLKLRFFIKNLGKKGLNNLITNRYKVAISFAKLLKSNRNFIVLNDVEINSVMFMFKGNLKHPSVDILNKINLKIHEKILKDGLFHLHKFSIEDGGVIKKGETLYPMRFMSGNPNIKKENLKKIIEYVESIGIEVIDK